MAKLKSDEGGQTEGSSVQSRIEQLEAMVEALSSSPGAVTWDLFLLRFRKGSIGVQTGYIRASSLQRAEQVGKAYCNSRVGHRYIGVERAIVADESILPGAEAKAS